MHATHDMHDCWRHCGHTVRVMSHSCTRHLTPQRLQRAAELCPPQVILVEKTSGGECKQQKLMPDLWKLSMVIRQPHWCYDAVPFLCFIVMWELATSGEHTCECSDKATARAMACRVLGAAHSSSPCTGQRLIPPR